MTDQGIIYFSYPIEALTLSKVYDSADLNLKAFNGYVRYIENNPLLILGIYDQPERFPIVTDYSNGKLVIKIAENSELEVWLRLLKKKLDDISGLDVEIGRYNNGFLFLRLDWPTEIKKYTPILIVTKLLCISTDKENSKTLLHLRPKIVTKHIPPKYSEI